MPGDALAGSMKEGRGERGGSGSGIEGEELVVQADGLAGSSAVDGGMGVRMHTRQIAVAKRAKTETNPG